MPILVRPDAVGAVPTLNVGRIDNITQYLMNSTLTNASATNQTPQWTPAMYEIFYSYMDVFPYFYLFLFMMPIALIYISTGSAKMCGICGVILSLLAFAFLPPAVTAFAALTIVLSFGITIWGLYKP